MTGRIIPVFIHGDRGYLWSSHDVVCLRTKLNFVELASRNLSKYSFQKTTNDLPIQISMESIMQALSKGWICTVRFDIRTLTSRFNGHLNRKLDIIKPKSASNFKSNSVKQLIYVRQTPHSKSYQRNRREISSKLIPFFSADNFSQYSMAFIFDL